MLMLIWIFTKVTWSFVYCPLGPLLYAPYAVLAMWLWICCELYSDMYCFTDNLAVWVVGCLRYDLYYFTGHAACRSLGLFGYVCTLWHELCCLYDLSCLWPELFCFVCINYTLMIWAVYSTGHVAVGLFAKADKEDQPDIYGRNTGKEMRTNK